MILSLVAAVAVSQQIHGSVHPEPGQLTIIERGAPGALCPLKGTKVDADVAGFGARVNVVQTFVNPTNHPIEAIYTFPLPHGGAVDRMRMKVGDRIIEGQIKLRDQARRIYEAAKRAGATASLLDQERPNIFTQSVANILPRGEVQIEISYVQVVDYEAGEFEFVFPMVVGPRYLASGNDADKISPPRPAPSTRTGANISLNISLDAGAPIKSLESVLHRVDTKREGANRAFIRLQRDGEIPNRDFILRYRVASNKVEVSFFTAFQRGRAGYFALVFVPPVAAKSDLVKRREVLFFIDQSGSQEGFPFQKSKELTQKLLRTLNPADTFNVFGFSSDVRQLFPSPVAASNQNLSVASDFVNGLRISGGTRLLQAMQAALKDPFTSDRERSIIFNTDGFVDNEAEVLKLIAQNRDNTRVYTFGIGNSVNRYLIEGMSREGNGAHEVVTLAEDADRAVERFLQRSHSPILSDIQLTSEGVKLDEVVPTRIPPVFNGRPVIVFGRYERGGTATLKLTGSESGQPWERVIKVNFPTDRGATSLASLWARTKVDSLLSQSRAAAVEAESTLGSEIAEIALQHGLITPFTSFVAVEPRIVNIGGRQRTIHVPVERVDGMSESQGGNVATGINYITYDPTDNSFIASDKSVTSAGGQGGGMGGGGFGGGAGGASSSGLYRGAPPARLRVDLEARRKEERYLAVVAQKLRVGTGKVEVMVWLDDFKPETLSALAKAGLTVADQSKPLKVVFGACTKEALKRLAEIKAVRAIDPLE